MGLLLGSGALFVKHSGDDVNHLLLHCEVAWDL